MAFNSLILIKIEFESRLHCSVIFAYHRIFLTLFIFSYLYAYLPIYLTIFIFSYLSIYLPICPSIFLCIFVSSFLSIYIPIINVLIWDCQVVSLTGILIFLLVQMNWDNSPCSVNLSWTRVSNCYNAVFLVRPRSSFRCGFKHKYEMNKIISLHNFSRLINTIAFELLIFNPRKFRSDIFILNFRVFKSYC